MKKNVLLIIIIAFFSVVSPISAQWIETNIYVPDSLCGALDPNSLTYNSTNNKIYVGGEYGDYLIVIDGISNQKITRIPIKPYVTALSYNPINNKVYAASGDSNQITVINGTTNTIITSIPVGILPTALCYNPINNKIYCANYNSNNILPEFLFFYKSFFNSESEVCWTTLGAAPPPTRAWRGSRPASRCSRRRTWRCGPAPIPAAAHRSPHDRNAPSSQADHGEWSACPCRRPGTVVDCP